MQANKYDLMRSVRVAVSFLLALGLTVGLVAPAAAGDLGTFPAADVEQEQGGNLDIGEMPFQQSVQAALKERAAEGLPVPKVSFASSVSPPGSELESAMIGEQPIKVTGKTILEFAGPEEAGYERWPGWAVAGELPVGASGAVVAGNYDQAVRDAVAVLAPDFWHRYEFGHEPRTYVYEETLEVLPPPNQAQAMAAIAETDIATVDQVVMGFTASGPNINYSISGSWKILGVTVAEARAGFELGWGAGLRLPMQATVTVPASMDEGQDYSPTNSLARLDWSASDYAAVGLAAENGNEFVLRYALFVGAWAKLGPVTVIDWSLADVSFDASRSFRTPFGTGDIFPIPYLDLSPEATALAWSLGSVMSLGIGFVIDPEIAAERITASWQAGSQAGALTHTAPDTAVAFGPIRESDFGPADTITVQIGGFRYWFTQFLIKLSGYLKFDLFGWGIESGHFSIAAVDLHDITGDMYLGVHAGTDGTVVAVSDRSPICAAAVPSIDRLWPVDDRFVAVEVQGVTDADGDPVQIVVTSIFQDEVVDALGCGCYGPDGLGVGTSTASLRAQSDSDGNGRMYHVDFTASDEHGGHCVGVVHVGVPESAAGEIPPVDDGELYDAAAANVKVLFMPVVLK